VETLGIKVEAGTLVWVGPSYLGLTRSSDSLRPLGSYTYLRIVWGLSSSGPGWIGGLATMEVLKVTAEVSTRVDSSG